MLDQYLEALLEDLRRSAEGEKLTQLTLASEAIEIDPDSAVAIGIIVNELVINAVKYAYPDSSGPIDVQLRRDGEGIELAIADKGVGMQSAPAPGSTGMGQRIVEAMATKLDAKIVRDPVAQRYANDPSAGAQAANRNLPASPRPARRPEPVERSSTGRPMFQSTGDVHALAVCYSPRMASRDSLHAEITPEVLLRAYACGIFPMAESADDPTLFWVEPEERGIIPLDGMRVSSRLARTVRSDRFTVTVDQCFDDVMDGCAERAPGRDNTWINGRIRTLYSGLHRMGHCHSVEVWDGDQLAGGLYGVNLGGAFFGESMFHRERDASKVALVHLVARLVGRTLHPARHAIRDRASAQPRRGRDSAPPLSHGTRSRAAARRQLRSAADRHAGGRRRCAGDPRRTLTHRRDDETAAFASGELRECRVQFLARIAVGELREGPLLEDLLRRAHEAAPGGARQMTAKADAAHAE